MKIIEDHIVFIKIFCCSKFRILVFRLKKIGQGVVDRD
jgi:hypothetical protein